MGMEGQFYSPDCCGSKLIVKNNKTLSIEHISEF